MSASASQLPAQVPSGPGSVSLLGLGLLLALLAWQGVLSHPWPSVEAWAAIFSPQPSLEGLLLWWVQMPRAFAGLVVGICLGLAGALMQLVTRNPLASPDLLGITAGAQLGIILGLALPVALMGLPLIFVGGLLAAAFTFALAGGWRTTPLRLTLAGVAMAQAFGALTALLLSLNDHAATIVSLWSTGSLRQLGWTALEPALWALPATVLVLIALRRPLNMALLGDRQMRVLGASPAWTKAAVILLGSLLTALAIKLAGPLGFIGLVAPNMLRYGFGVIRPSRLIPLSALWGAVLTLLADVLVAAVEPYLTLPLGVLSALLGALAILILLRYTQHPAAVAQTAPMPGGTVRQRLPLGAFAAAMLVALSAAMLFGLFHGHGEYGAAALWRGLLDGEDWAWALLDLRLPRLLVDVVGGALLATSGLILQAVTRNPLAGPQILGVSQMAALAVLVASILVPEASAVWRFPIAWAGALAALALVVGLNLRHGLEPLRLVLTGFALTGMVLALVSLLIAQYSTNPAQALIWMVGSSYGRTWGDLLGMLPWLLLGLPLAWLSRRWMDLLVLGDGVAGSLGLPTASTRLLLVALASLMIAAAVAGFGPVAFVGLLVPHAVRLLGFQTHRQRLIAAPLLGGVLLVLADLIGQRLLAPIDIPVGIATAAIGAPCFLFLLSRTYFKRASE